MREFETVEDVVRDLNPSYPMFCIRPHVIRKTAANFVENFPGRVLYAVKCNPHPLIVDLLHEGGIRHFDTASLGEIADTRNRYPNAGIYYMHPVKGRAAIASAYNVYRCRVFSVDHLDELHKILEETGGEGITIMVRLACSGDDVGQNLSSKFGAEVNEAAQILITAEAEGCKTGLAFHVGSQCTNPNAYLDALDRVKKTLEISKSEIRFLDVGGGFPAPYLNDDLPALDEYIDVIKAGIKNLKLRQDCTIMVEPGRALVAEGMTLLTQVHLRKDDKLYINDGVYGALQETIVGGIEYPVHMIRPDEETSSKMANFHIFGPTCDSFDKLPTPVSLPSDIREGDWIEFDNMGAYSNSTRTQFNGFFTDVFVKIMT